MKRRHGRDLAGGRAAVLSAARKSRVQDHGDAIASRIASGNLTRERSCDGKTRFKSYDFADRVGKSKGELHGKVMRVYACPFCSGFHLASVAEIAS